MGCTQEQAKDIFVNMGFIPGKDEKLDHIVSTLTGGWCIKYAKARTMIQRARETAVEMLLLQKRLWSGSQDASAPNVVRPLAGLSGHGAAPV